MLAFLVDAAYLVGGLLGILLLLLPFLGLLAVCVIYLMFDIIEGFRGRRTRWCCFAPTITTPSPPISPGDRLI